MTVYLLHSVMEASLAAVSSTLSMSPHCRLSPHTVMGPSVPSVSFTLSWGHQHCLALSVCFTLSWGPHFCLSHSHCLGALSAVCLVNSLSSQTETLYPRNTNSSSPWYSPYFCLCEFSYKHLLQGESYRFCSFVTGLFHWA